MRSDVWFSESGGAMYDSRCALVYRRHDTPADGRGRINWTGGVEAGRFLGVDRSEAWGMGAPVVVDDFGDIVRVPEVH